MSSPIYKIVVLGEGTFPSDSGRVGKTSISIKYVRDEFDDKQRETINASYLEKNVRLDSDQQVKLTIWVPPSLVRIQLDRNSIIR